MGFGRKLVHWGYLNASTIPCHYHRHHLTLLQITQFPSLYHRLHFALWVHRVMEKIESCDWWVVAYLIPEDLQTSNLHLRKQTENRCCKINEGWHLWRLDRFTYPNLLLPLNYEKKARSSCIVVTDFLQVCLNRGGDMWIEQQPAQNWEGNWS